MDSLLAKESDDLLAYQGRWVNLWFSKDGVCIKGITSYASEEEAKRGVISFFASLKDEEATFVADKKHPGVARYSSNRHSHVIQAPLL